MWNKPTNSRSDVGRLRRNLGLQPAGKIEVVEAVSNALGVDQAFAVIAISSNLS
jgi:hypothetical protein